MKAFNGWGSRRLVNVQKGVSICSCCGSTYYKLKDMLSSADMGCGNGIGVYETDKIPPSDNDYVKIDVIQTSNGPITFALRKK